jgi:aspartate kinase
VADAEGIKRVARRVVDAHNAGDEVVVVVSAMGDTTDELLDLAGQVTDSAPAREMDMLLSAGERISMALLAMAINKFGASAQSFTGSQAGMITDGIHGKARIIDVDPHRIRTALDKGHIAIVAGFQGMSRTTNEITTLGRGGSDTTAVALAAALKAECCEIYTDVDGVYSADPRLEPAARKLGEIGYEDMLELAASGARVLQLRSVEYARRYGVPLHVRSSFSDDAGTWVREAPEGMEDAMISGVAHDDGEAKVTIERVPDQPGVAARIFKSVAAEGVNVDMIVQNVSHDGSTDLSFTAPEPDLPRLTALMEDLVEEIGAERYTVDEGIAKVSLIGAGMKSHPGVAADMFDALAAEKINIEMISTSSIRVSCVIRADDVERAVRAIHSKFGLGEG